MARCEPRSASVTRSKRPFSRTWKRVRHSSSTAAPRLAASQAASRYVVRSALVIMTLSGIDLHPAIAVEPDLDVRLAVFEIDAAAQRPLHLNPRRALRQRAGHLTRAV